MVQKIRNQNGHGPRGQERNRNGRPANGVPRKKSPDSNGGANGTWFPSNRLLKTIGLPQTVQERPSGRFLRITGLSL